jgi:hypothetical protein
VTAEAQKASSGEIGSYNVPIQAVSSHSPRPQFRLTPAKVKVWPCRLAPRAFMTNSEGTMLALTTDLPGGGALVAPVLGVCADADNGMQNSRALVINA